MPKRNPRNRLGIVAAFLVFACVPAEARPMTKIYDRLLYPEGPVFDGDNLLFADMLMGQILHYDHGAVNPVLSDDNCGPTSLAKLPSGHWLTSCHLTHELIFFDPRYPKQPYLIAREDFRRPNDMIAGAAGVYVTESGEFDPSAPITGKVWLVKGPRDKKLVAENIHYANGDAVTADGRSLLVCEHLARRVWRYAINSDGTLGLRTLAFDVGKALSGPITPLTGPDGIEAAPDGSFYVAVNGRASVMHVAADGHVIETYETPGYPFTTNVVLTPDGRGIYAVSNRMQPRQAGALFYIDLSKS